MSDFLFISIPIILIVGIIMYVVKDNQKRQLKEESENITEIDGNKKQICYWCKQEINIGAKLCPFCKKVPTKTGNENRQVEIFVGIILFIVAFLLMFGGCGIKIYMI